MKKMLMYLFGCLDTDARVRRTITALDQDFDIDIVCEKSATFRNIKQYNYNIKRNTIQTVTDSIKLFLKILKENDYDAVYGNDFYSTLLILRIASRCKRRHIKVIYDAHELIIEKNMSFFSKTRLLMMLEGKVIKIADKCVAADEKRIKVMKEYYNTDRYIHEYRNISSLPHTTSSIVEEFPFDTEKIKIIYAGVLTSNRGIEKLITAAGKIENIQLILVGDGPAKRDIADLTEKNVKSYIIHDKVKYDQLYPIISMCDIGYVYYSNNTLNNIYSASNKVYEYLSAGVAILANDNQNVKKVIERYNVGLSGDDLDYAMEQVIQELDMYQLNAKKVDIQALESQELSLLREYIIQEDE